MRIFVLFQMCTFINSGTSYQPCHTLTGQHLLADSNALSACQVLVLSYIEADYAIAKMNELPMFPCILWMSCLRQDTACP